MTKQRNYRSSVSKLCILLIALSCNQSEARAKSELSPVIMKAIVDWSTCRATKLIELIKTDRSAESIVDQAYKECVKFESVTVEDWEKEFGPNTRYQVIEMREHWRKSSIASVNSARTGAPVSEPTSSWGQCVGRNVPEIIPNNADSSSIAENAMAACASERERIRQDWSQKFGTKSANAHVETMQSEIRKKVISIVEAKRQP